MFKIKFPTKHMFRFFPMEWRRFVTYLWLWNNPRIYAYVCGSVDYWKSNDFC